MIGDSIQEAQPELRCLLEEAVEMKARIKVAAAHQGDETRLRRKLVLRRSHTRRASEIAPAPATSLLVLRPTFAWADRDKLISQVIDAAVDGLLA